MGVCVLRKGRWIIILTFPSTCVLEVASYTHKTLVPCSWTRRRERAKTWKHVRISHMCRTE